MDPKEFGRFLSALMEEHKFLDGYPLSVGQLACKSGLPEDLIYVIKEGGRAKLDREILRGLAKGLELTSRERQQFFYAAVRVEYEDVAGPKQQIDQVRADQMKLMERLELPAFISDTYGNIFLANAAVLNLLGIGDDQINGVREQKGSFNLLRVIFDEKIVGFHNLA